MQTSTTSITNINVSQKRTSQFKLKWMRFCRNKLAICGLVIIIILVIAVAAAPLYIDHSRVTNQSMSERFQSPGSEYIFGTDQFGRDLFARIMYGGRISIFVGLATAGISFAIGLILGCSAGFLRGWVDTILMRICDIIMAVPSTLLAMAIVAALGQGIDKMLIALSVGLIPQQTRTIRASVMMLSGQEYVDAARTYGMPTPLILLKHIVPNIIGPLVIGIMMGIGSTILRIASLGYLGIGIASPTPEWGTIISENQNAIRYHPYLGIIPGLFIMVTVMCMNFVGNGLRDALDPKMKN